MSALDRDKAREALYRLLSWSGDLDAHVDATLDRLEECVQPDSNSDAIAWRQAVADGTGYAIPETGEIADAATVVEAFREATLWAADTNEVRAHAAATQAQLWRAEAKLERLAELREQVDENNHGWIDADEFSAVLLGHNDGGAA